MEGAKATLACFWGLFIKVKVRGVKNSMCAMMYSFISSLLQRFLQHSWQCSYPHCAEPASDLWLKQEFCQRWIKWKQVWALSCRSTWRAQPVQPWGRNERNTSTHRHTHPYSHLLAVFVVVFADIAKVSSKCFNSQRAWNFSTFSLNYNSCIN